MVSEKEAFDKKHSHPAVVNMVPPLYFGPLPLPFVALEQNYVYAFAYTNIWNSTTIQPSRTLAARVALAAP